MTKKEAHNFMWEKEHENPQLRWSNHVSIRALHDDLIDKIYDDFESRTCENCTYKPCPDECMECSQFYHNKFKPKLDNQPKKE